MFTIFKKQQKSTKEIVEQIHREFETASDRLLKEAKELIEIKSLEIVKNKELSTNIPEKNKADSLKNLGFKNCFIVTDIEQKEKIINSKIKEDEKILNARTKVAEALTYFSNKYPIYKFITIEEVEVICNKYNLVYGNVGLFKGFVPQKNLKEIENFKLKDEDYPLMLKKSISFINHEIIDWLTVKNWIIEYKRTDEYKYNEIYHTQKLNYIFDRSSFDYQYHTSKLAELINISENPSNFKSNRMPLEIAAPIKDMNMEGKEVRNYKIIEKVIKQEIPDPVVLQPCMYNEQKCYAIVTAWGDEASDPIVVNNVMN